MSLIYRVKRAITKVERFVPQKRFALLLNRLDEPQCLVGKYTRLDRHARGNESLFRVEAALNRGRLNLKHELRDHFMKKGDREGFLKAKEINAKARELYYESGFGIKGILQVPGWFPNDSQAQAAEAALKIYCYVYGEFYNRPLSSIHYSQLRKVFPDHFDIKRDFFEILSFYRGLADEHSLTLLFIRAHGYPEGLPDFRYVELLDQLDLIQGKKVIINICCYSGTLVTMVKDRPTADQYVVIASTRPDKPGATWNEDNTFNDIIELIESGKPIRQFIPRTYRCEHGKQTPTLHIPFDVVL